MPSISTQACSVGLQQHDYKRACRTAPRIAIWAHHPTQQPALERPTLQLPFLCDLSHSRFLTPSGRVVFYFASLRVITLGGSVKANYLTQVCSDATTTRQSDAKPQNPANCRP